MAAMGRDDKYHFHAIFTADGQELDIQLVKSNYLRFLVPSFSPLITASKLVLKLCLTQFLSVTKPSQTYRHASRQESRQTDKQNVHHDTEVPHKGEKRFSCGSETDINR